MAGMVAARRLGLELATEVLVRLWSRFAPPAPPVPTVSTAPSDRLQRAMNLIMPLHIPNIAARGRLAQLLFEATDELLAGLNNVGTVHFARFDIVDGNLCMFSIYDGELDGYIRDFIASIGDVFDAIVAHVKDPPPTPVALHADEFIEWIRAHDAYQMFEASSGFVGRDLGAVQRNALLTLHIEGNVQLGLYRGYPGFSAAQIRQRLSIGW